MSARVAGPSGCNCVNNSQLTYLVIVNETLKEEFIFWTKLGFNLKEKNLLGFNKNNILKKQVSAAISSLL